MGRSIYRTQQKYCASAMGKNRQRFHDSLMSTQVFLHCIFGTIAFYFEKLE